jgi:hypothetical protein
MANKFKIPEEELEKIRKRDKRCVYCHKQMIFPYNVKNHKDSVTIEHLNSEGPFYWSKGLKRIDIVLCCGSCNSSRGIKKLKDWFKTEYCIKRNINEKTIAQPVKDYLKRKK